MKYRYTTVRSVRKSISVNVSSDNKITVRCPWSMPEREIEKFLDSKQDWIERVTTKNSLKLALNNGVVMYEQVLMQGIAYPLVFGDRREITPQAVYVTGKNDLFALYKEKFFGEFKERVEKFSKSALLYPASVSLKDYKGRWGCCDAKNNLIFNYKLFMLPESAQNYVIVHELCHTICHNHSQAFWKLVGEVLPDYKLLKKQLHDYDFLTSMY